MALLTFGTRDQTDEREEEQAYKTCPICGSPVFSDMDVCYSCLFEWEAAVEPEPSGFGPAISRDIAAIEDLPLLRVRTPYADFDAPVPDEGLTIGRSPSNGIAIHSRTVEREHARIVPGPEGLAVELIDPFARAWLDGTPIEGRSALAEGQILDIADASFVCRRAMRGSDADAKGVDG